MSEAADSVHWVSAAPYDRLRLTALRYAVNDESEQYVAVMRVFTAGTAGLLSDLSAREVADSLHVPARLGAGRRRRRRTPVLPGQPRQPRPQPA